MTGKLSIAIMILCVLQGLESRTINPSPRANIFSCAIQEANKVNDELQQASNETNQCLSQVIASFPDLQSSIDELQEDLSLLRNETRELITGCASEAGLNVFKLIQCVTSGLGSIQSDLSAIQTQIRNILSEVGQNDTQLLQETNQCLGSLLSSQSSAIANIPGDIIGCLLSSDSPTPLIASKSKSLSFSPAPRASILSCTIQEGNKVNDELQQASNETNQCLSQVISSFPELQSSIDELQEDLSSLRNETRDLITGCASEAGLNVFKLIQCVTSGLGSIQSDLSVIQTQIRDILSEVGQNDTQLLQETNQCLGSLLSSSSSAITNIPGDIIECLGSSDSPTPLIASKSKSLSFSPAPRASILSCAIQEGNKVNDELEQASNETTQCLSQITSSFPELQSSIDELQEDLSSLRNETRDLITGCASEAGLNVFKFIQCVTSGLSSIQSDLSAIQTQIRNILSEVGQNDTQLLQQTNQCLGSLLSSSSSAITNIPGDIIECLGSSGSPTSLIASKSKSLSFSPAPRASILSCAIQEGNKVNEELQQASNETNQCLSQITSSFPELQSSIDELQEDLSSLRNETRDLITGCASEAGLNVFKFIQCVTSGLSSIQSDLSAIQTQIRNILSEVGQNDTQLLQETNQCLGSLLSSSSSAITNIPGDIIECLGSSGSLIASKSKSRRFSPTPRANILSCAIQEGKKVNDELQQAGDETNQCLSQVTSSFPDLQSDIDQLQEDLSSLGNETRDLTTSCASEAGPNVFKFIQCLTSGLGPIRSELSDIQTRIRNILSDIEQHDSQLIQETNQCLGSLLSSASSAIGKIPGDIVACLGSNDVTTASPKNLAQPLSVVDDTIGNIPEILGDLAKKSEDIGTSAIQSGENVAKCVIQQQDIIDQLLEAINSGVKQCFQESANQISWLPNAIQQFVDEAEQLGQSTSEVIQSCVNETSGWIQISSCITSGLRELQPQQNDLINDLTDIIKRIQSEAPSLGQQLQYCLSSLFDTLKPQVDTILSNIQSCIIDSNQ